MSRYIGWKAADAILSAGEHWKTEALLAGQSVFSRTPIWSNENLEELYRRFNENPDETERSFTEKLHDQLEGSPAAVKELAAEIVWLLLLCPSNISAERKRENVRTIWDWSGTSFPADSPWLTDKVLSGIGSAGPGFNNHRPKELAFCINFLLAFRRLEPSVQAKLASEPWTFAQWIQSLPEAQSRQFRHMVLYLLFPDDFERIFSAGDRRLVAEAFGDFSRQQISKMTAVDLDKALNAIRKRLEQSHGNPNLDFYESPLKESWQSSQEAPTALTADHVRSALAEIDRDGVPGDARSTTYDLVHDGKRYPPKLVYSLAHRYATGTPLDRSEFAGGDDTEAFRILRNLGFLIVSKRLIGDLVEKFLAQANAADDQQTSSYPKEYRGLKIRVSFGQGGFSRIPWIAFLADGERVSEGIYPVLLYYKEAQLLILAYGVSETNPPPRTWQGLSSAQTIEDYLLGARKRRPERYGNSFVDIAYELPDGLDVGELSKHLDAMIDRYSETLAASGTGPASAPPQISSYSISDALQDLFVSEEHFAQLLDRLREKKNIILQGPPGVGKTFFASRLASAFCEATGADRIRTVQFHASYSYEDFVQGYRPDGKGSFARKDGVFLRFCLDALANPTEPYVFVIDEINRANLSKVFGELLMLIENDKRSEQFAVELAYSTEADKRFFVPSNVHLVGLMNTADRSLALVDYALRRRFAFFDVKPGFETPQFGQSLASRGVPDAIVSHIRNVLPKLNDAIAADRDLGRGFAIGHSFFCKLPADEAAEEAYNKVIEHEIVPLLREYWYEGGQADEWRQRLILK